MDRFPAASPAGKATANVDALAAADAALDTEAAFWQWALDPDLNSNPSPLTQTPAPTLPFDPDPDL